MTVMSCLVEEGLHEKGLGTVIANEGPEISGHFGHNARLDRICFNS